MLIEELAESYWDSLVLKGLITTSISYDNDLKSAFLQAFYKGHDVGYDAGYDSGYNSLEKWYELQKTDA